MRYAVVAVSALTLGGSGLVAASASGLMPNALGIIGQLVVINGCFDNITGALRIVRSPLDCSTNETYLGFQPSSSRGSVAIAAGRFVELIESSFNP